MQQILLHHISGHMKNVPGSSQHGLTEDKSFLRKLIAFCEQRPVIVQEQKVLDVIYHDFSKVLVTVSTNILEYK